jgi:hypothetical protein
MSDRQGRLMQIPARVNWPGNRRRGILTTDHPESSGGIPVLVIDGEVRLARDLPSGCKVVVTWGGPYSELVWTLVKRAKEDARYPVVFFATSKD